MGNLTCRTAGGVMLASPPPAVADAAPATGQAGTSVDLGAPGDGSRVSTSPTTGRRPSRIGDPSEWFARAVICGLFLALASRLATDFLETGRMTGLLLLASEFLVVVLTVARRTAGGIDRSLRARLFTGLSILGPALAIPVTDPVLASDAVTTALSGCGLLIVVVGKLSLGRSFGLIPANRGVVCSGLYRWLRHPIYAGYLITHVAFVMAHPSSWNIVVFVGADLALLIRATYEEQLLQHDPVYAHYLERVRWRVAPGLF